MYKSGINIAHLSNPFIFGRSPVLKVILDDVEVPHVRIVPTCLLLPRLIGGG